MSRQMRNDKVIGGTSNNASAILYKPADTSRAETSAEAEFDRINEDFTDLSTKENANTLGERVSVSNGYVIPADGYIEVQCTYGAGNYIYVSVSGIPIQVCSPNSVGNPGYATSSMFVRKGMTVNITASTSGDNHIFYHPLVY